MVITTVNYYNGGREKKSQALKHALKLIFLGVGTDDRTNACSCGANGGNRVVDIFLRPNTTGILGI